MSLNLFARNLRHMIAASFAAFALSVLWVCLVAITYSAIFYKLAPGLWGELCVKYLAGSPPDRLSLFSTLLIAPVVETAALPIIYWLIHRYTRLGVSSMRLLGFLCVFAAALVLHGVHLMDVGRAGGFVILYALYDFLKSLQSAWASYGLVVGSHMVWNVLGLALMLLCQAMLA